MEWYYAKNGVQGGPVLLAELQRMVASGEIEPHEMAWCEGMADWQPVSSLPDLSPCLSSQPAPPSAIGTPVAAPAAVPIPVTRTSSLAIISLVCGVVGLFGLFVCFVPALLGIGGIICGHLALREIRKSETPVEGRGLAIGGLVTGYLSLVLMVLFLVIFSMGLVLNAKTESHHGRTSIRVGSPSQQLVHPDAF